MSTTEQAGQIIEAATLLLEIGAHRNSELTEGERRDAELGLARRKVALYEVLQAERPDDQDTADVLAGARARLAVLEGDELPPRRRTP